MPPLQVVVYQVPKSVVDMIHKVRERPGLLALLSTKYSSRYGELTTCSSQFNEETPPHYPLCTCFPAAPRLGILQYLARSNEAILPNPETNPILRFREVFEAAFATNKKCFYYASIHEERNNRSTPQEFSEVMYGTSFGAAAKVNCDGMKRTRFESLVCG